MLRAVPWVWLRQSPPTYPALWLSDRRTCVVVSILFCLLSVWNSVSVKILHLHLKKEGNDDQRVAASPEIGNVTPNLWMDLILQQGRSEAFLEQFTPTARGAIPSQLSCPQVAPPTLTPSLSSASPSQQVMVIMMLQKGVISHWGS